MKNGILAGRRDLKNDARVLEDLPECASEQRGPIEITIGSQNQRVIGIRAIGLIERIDDFELTGRCDLVYIAAPAVSISSYFCVSSASRGAVEVPIHALYGRSNGIDAIGAAQDVKTGFLASSAQLNYISRAKRSPLIRAPEISIRPQRQAADRQDLVPDCMVEAVHDSQLSLRSDLERGAI